MLDFLKENWQFLSIVGGTILVIVIAYWIYTGISRRRLRTKNRREDPNREIALKQEPVVTKPEPVSNPQVVEVAKVDNEVAITLDEELEITDEIDEDDEEDSQSKETVSAKHKTALPDVEEPEIEEFDDGTTGAKSLGRYHVIYRVADQRWVVKREGSSKVLRTLHTQKEAIAYATIKAITQDTTFVIHKKDGKIRKQKY